MAVGGADPDRGTRVGSVRCGWWQLIAALGGGAEGALVWDGEGAIEPSSAGRPAGGADAPAAQAFRGTLGCQGDRAASPPTPKRKGLVERAQLTTWSARSCPAGTFTGPADFNDQLAGWLAVANTWPRRAPGCAPAERIAADKAAMLALLPVAPHDRRWRLA